ncbi:hypothetical protein MM01_00022 [Escherichia phage vB_EcoS_MM01]|uniref:DUF4054 domain-containing protein n=1 Tax=Escherichia phage vB_EcoS_MM01 TaxID=2508188 RepID=A0A482N2Y1_9CAUD|nr:hypothetical protein MM01_00022 [Escherichia phage vB_EcoS_MM01]
MNEQVIAFMRSLVPALSAVPDETIDVWVDLARLYVCESKFGIDSDRAVGLYALHLMLSDGAFKASGESLDSYGKRMASYSLSGEFSISYDTQSAASGDLSSSQFGRMYKALLRKKGGGFGLITSAGGGGCGCR